MAPFSHELYATQNAICFKQYQLTWTEHFVQVLA